MFRIFTPFSNKLYAKQYITTKQKKNSNTTKKECQVDWNETGTNNIKVKTVLIKTDFLKKELSNMLYRYMYIAICK